ncbi:MAG: zinc ribbon domain-containing protein [Methanobacteriota archaeon]|nr:MAG: zinc ribbon domain-containing protein [Euryarchaeota archaeon]
MKCPDCGAENADDAVHCQGCAIQLPVGVAIPRRRNARRATATLVVILVVVMVASLAMNTVYLDPSSSWNPAIRDHDGDGVPDESDPSPFDADVWAYGSATVILAISNDYTRPVCFTWLLEQVGEGSRPNIRWEPTVPPFEDLGVADDMTWLIGETTDMWEAYVICSIEELDYRSSILDLGEWLVRDGQSYTFVLTFPDDFPAPWPP